MSIIFSALRMVPKGLEKRLEEWEISGRFETIQSTVKLRPARILRKGPWKAEETCCHLDSSESQPADAGKKNVLGVE